MAVSEKVADLLSVMMSANPTDEISCQLNPVPSQWIMLENFYDVETEEEEEQRLILKAQSVASEARETLVEAERQLDALKPMLVETVARVRQRSQWLNEARAMGNAAEEARYARLLEECQQHSKALQERIQTLEKVRNDLTQHLKWIRERGTHG